MKFETTSQVHPCRNTRPLSETPHGLCTAWVWLFALLCSCGLAPAASGQESGGVSGFVVSAWDGTPLANVTITVRGTTLAVQTDSSGHYELKEVTPGDHVLRFSKSGFASVSVSDVRVLAGQTTTVNGHLRPEFYEMEEYEVTAEEFTAQTEQILIERQKSSGMLEGLGSDQISRLGAGDAAEALTKVTGASVADGKFAVIRGLADRYTATTLNGNDLPSADPDRKAAQLDLFPSAFIERMDVSKTFSPDMPGGFSGGAIDIVTKSYPDHFYFSLSLGGAYNTQASLRDDFPTSDQSTTDWLAMDDGKRALPDDVAETSPKGGGAVPGIKDSFVSRQLAPVPKDSPLNSGFALAFGDSQNVFGKPFGYLAGLSYKNEYNFYDNGTVARYEYWQDQVKTNIHKSDVKGSIEYNWGAFTALAFRPFEHHDLKFNFMFVQSAEDEARHLQGYDEPAGSQESMDIYADQNILHWTERNLTYFQLAGRHEFPDLNSMRLDWAASTSTTAQDEPDHRIFQTVVQPDEPYYYPYAASPPTFPTRYWRNIEEDNKSVRADLTIPFPSYNSKENALKTGVWYSHSERDFFQRGFSIIDRNHPYRRTGDLGSFLDPTNSAYYDYYNFPINAEYQGQQTIWAGYVMVDWAAFEWLRLVGGARYESTDISIAGTNLTLGAALQSGQIHTNHLLPSIGATIYLRDNLLLRAAWSQTVVRPTYREIAKVDFYDPARNRVYLGNPNLVMSESDNYDVRLEWYPKPAAIVSLGAFMKKIKNPIELAGDKVDNSTITFENFEKADVAGLEGELRLNLGTLWKPLDQFTLGFNGAYIQSEVPLTDEQRKTRAEISGIHDTERPLYDQPEYVINGDLTWNYPGTGTTLTLAGGVVGRRLVLVGLGLPDDYEEPSPQLDVFLSQNIGKHWKMKFSAKNLLDPVFEVTQTHPKFGTLPIRSYTRGITLGLSLGCEF